jgi:hypothetical protein
MGIKEAIRWLILNDDIQEAAFHNFEAKYVPLSITMGFICDNYNITEEQLFAKLKKEYERNEK